MTLFWYYFEKNYYLYHYLILSLLEVSDIYHYIYFCPSKYFVISDLQTIIHIIFKNTCNFRSTEFNILRQIQKMLSI
jgi:hypothetical protein